MFFLWCCCSATILTFSFLGLRDPLSFNSWSYGWIRDIWIFSDIIWLQGKTCCFVFHNLKCNDFLVTSPKSYEGMHVHGGPTECNIWQNNHHLHSMYFPNLSYSANFVTISQQKKVGKCDSNVCGTIFLLCDNKRHIFPE